MSDIHQTASPTQRTGRNGPREVVVTGMGLVLPGCSTRDEFWEQLSQAKSQLVMQPNPLDPAENAPMGRVVDFDPYTALEWIPERFVDRYSREIQMYLASVHRGLRDAQLELPELDSRRVGLFDGCSRPAISTWYERARATAAIHPRHAFSRRDLMTYLPAQTVGIAASLLRVRGPTYIVNAACSSGGVAIGHASREIALGAIDVALATGHETPLDASLFAMYGDADLLSHEREDATRSVSPWDLHSTNTFAEGAVSLVLESREHAEARGARIIATVGGFQHGNSGYHPTSLDALGLRAAEMIHALVHDAQCALEDVAFVVGHGNGVPVSDLSEENYMRQAFGARSKDVPLMSVKPIYGHSLGASSSTNAAAAALCVAHDFILPTANVDPANTRQGANHQGGQGKAALCEAGITLSYGMGGQNAGLIFTK